MMRTMSPLIDGLYRQGEKIADTKAPHDVPIARRWEQRKFNAQLVNPAKSELGLPRVSEKITGRNRSRSNTWHGGSDYTECKPVHVWPFVSRGAGCSGERSPASLCGQ